MEDKESKSKLKKCVMYRRACGDLKMGHHPTSWNAAPSQSAAGGPFNSTGTT
jgi:hypothetical protein